eukprot:GFYU01056129.1.p1 GENE.GFYU01056129.1~~GFYU01056129.1.p1  ORF type:complete len:100 (-),score=8.84 GFYU01056129.1:204-503(-)
MPSQDEPNPEERWSFTDAEVGDNQDIGAEHLSCVKAFDALWFCYTPVNQFTEYYRNGRPDPCTDQARAWGQCMKLKYYLTSGNKEKAEVNLNPTAQTLC